MENKWKSEIKLTWDRVIVAFDSALYDVACRLLLPLEACGYLSRAPHLWRMLV